MPSIQASIHHHPTSSLSLTLSHSLTHSLTQLSCLLTFGIIGFNGMGMGLIFKCKNIQFSLLNFSEFLSLFSPQKRPFPGLNIYIFIIRWL
jgi:hypothetical protein